jgi:biotin carboxyl carrier protein
MSIYTITINGKAYDVSVEKKGGVPAVQTVAAAPATAAAPAPAVSAAAGTTISAPMPGKIIAVKVNVGDKVKKGQELVIVEAMKMHNPVLAATDGVVREIYIAPGEPIKTGAELVLIG